MEHDIQVMITVMVFGSPYSQSANVQFIKKKNHPTKLSLLLLGYIVALIQKEDCYKSNEDL